MRLFDVYIAIDWSSKNVPSPKKPSKDSIWISEKVWNNLSKESYFRTRQECKTYLKKVFLEYTKLEYRIFVWFDFAYGYPKGFSKSIGLNKWDIPLWKQLWEKIDELITDDENNCNNRFQVAAKLNLLCWGKCIWPLRWHPVWAQIQNLNIKSPIGGYPYEATQNIFIEKFRNVDKFEISKGIQPIWKLIGAGSVWGQSLVWIPVLNQLHNDIDLKSFTKIWPYETGFTSNPTPEKWPFILHCEIWPWVVWKYIDKSIELKDKAQVKAVVDRLYILDNSEKLWQLFECPDTVSEENKKICIEEEGWIIWVWYRDL